MYSMNASEKNTQSIRVNILPSYLHMADEPTFYLSQYDKGLYLYKVLLYEKNRKFNIDDLEDKKEEEVEPTPTPDEGDESGEGGSEEGGESGGETPGENGEEGNGGNNEGNTENNAENGENTEPNTEPTTEPTEPTENTDNTGGESGNSSEEPIVGDGEDNTIEPIDTPTDPINESVVEPTETTEPSDGSSDTPNEGNEGGESGGESGGDPSDEPTPEPEPEPEPEPSHIHVYIQGVKPDNKAFRYECTFNKNVVYLPEQKQITNVPGIVVCTVIIVKDGLRKTSEPFYLKIEKSLIQDISNISKDEVVKLDGDEEAEYVEPTDDENNGEITPSGETTDETGETTPENTNTTEP